jgi:uncharacterized membrane protein YkvA (DUF1232 family)
MRVTIELEPDDIARFEAALARARRLAATMDEVDVIAAARAALDQLPLHVAPSYVRRQFASAARLVEMLEDDAWALPQPWREDVLVTLIYLGDPEDMIPDDAEVIGLLDDAIMLELLLRRLAGVMRAYERFCVARAAMRPGRGSAARVEAAAWLARRRAALQRRMAQSRKPAPRTLASRRKTPAKPGSAARRTAARARR